MTRTYITGIHTGMRGRRISECHMYIHPYGGCRGRYVGVNFILATGTIVDRRTSSSRCFLTHPRVCPGMVVKDCY